MWLVDQWSYALNIVIKSFFALACLMAEPNDLTTGGGLI